MDKTKEKQQKQKKQQLQQIHLLKTQKKMNKLKKVKIWPSILFFVLALCIALTSVIILVSVFTSYMLQEKFETALQRTQFIESAYVNTLLEGASYDEAITIMQRENRLSDAVAVLDDNGNVLASYGTLSYDLTQSYDFELWDEYRFYLDTGASGQLFNHGGHIKLSMQQILRYGFSANGEPSSEWMNDVVINEPYWMVVSNQTHHLHVLVRNEVVLARNDVLFIGIVGVGILTIMCIPLLFLFFNVLANILRQRRMYLLLSMDSVTGGYNWFYYNQRANRIMNRSRNADKSYAVIHFTYGKYRSLCSCHGMQAGEQLLQQLNEILSSKLERGELCAHTSEADFALLIHCQSKEDAYKRINTWFEEISGILAEGYISYSAGVCMVNAVGKGSKGKKGKRGRVDVVQLYHNASIARDSILNDDKEILFFDDAMRAQQLWEHHIEENMGAALINEEFKVYIQPKYNPVTNELSGAEALVRWVNAEDGLITPGRFIPIFEKDGFITKLDDYMIAHVAALQMQWIDDGKKVVPISVNVSRAHFMRTDLAEHICELVDQYGLPHELLEIELTESAFFDDKEALLKTVNALKSLGFYVSMDDFGAGYSSLNSLKELPLDVLKLDAEFFRGEYDRARGDIVVSEAIRLAKQLDMKIVAEGIEEKEQVDFLAGLGCDMIQGYYFARPMPADEYGMKMEEDHGELFRQRGDSK